MSGIFLATRTQRHVSAAPFSALARCSSSISKATSKRAFQNKRIVSQAFKASIDTWQFNNSPLGKQSSKINV